MKVKKIFLSFLPILSISSPALISSCSDNKQEITEFNIIGQNEIWIEPIIGFSSVSYKAEINNVLTTNVDWSIKNLDDTVVDKSIAEITNTGILKVYKNSKFNLICKSKNSDTTIKQEINVYLNLFNLEKKISFEKPMYEINGWKENVTQQQIQDNFPDHILKFPKTYEIESIYGFVKNNLTTIPQWIETVDMSNTIVKIIPSDAFKYGLMKQILFPKTLEIIESSAFYKCENLLKIDLPDSVYEIENTAFSLCSSLKEINIPLSISSLGNSFIDCPINKIDVSKFKNIKYDSEIKYPLNCFTTPDPIGKVIVSHTSDIEEWKKILFELGIRTRDESQSVWPSGWTFEIK